MHNKHKKTQSMSATFNIINIKGSTFWKVSMLEKKREAEKGENLLLTIIMRVTYKRDDW